MINALLQEPFLITSEKHQTTRKHVRCILTGSDYQIIFVDTPGTQVPKNKLGEYMAAEIGRAAEDADLVLVIIDATKADKQSWLEFSAKIPHVLVLNKIDLLEQDVVIELLSRFETEGKFEAVVPVSASEAVNMDKLIDTLKMLLPEGEMLYPEDQLLDTDLRFVASEVIREQALKLLNDEVPHGVAVEIEQFRESDAEAKIQASIIVEKESHKPIVIGRGGQMLGRIGKSARMKLTELLNVPVHLKLFVKVRKNWRKDPVQLKALGYK